MWTVHLTHTRKTRNAYKIVVRKTEGKRSQGRSGSKWKDNVKMDPEIACGDVDYIKWLTTGFTAGFIILLLTIQEGLCFMWFAS